MRRTVVTLLLAAAVVFLAAPGAMAQGTLENPDSSYLGVTNFIGLDTAGSGSESYHYRYHLRGGRSYAGFCSPIGEDDDGGPVGDCQVTWLTPGGADVGTDLNATAEPYPAGGDAAAIIPAADGYHVLRIVNQSSTFNPDYNVLAFETTVFSPWYFVSSSDGYDGFIEVKNNTASPLPVTITVYNSSGAVVGSPRNQTLPPNGNEVVPVGTSFGVANGFGSVQIAHRNMFGAVSANITTLSAMTGLSFDAPFSTRSGVQAEVGESWW